MKYTFTGAFAPFICGLIEKKQALGHDYHGSACILRTFDKFCREQFPHETCLTAELAMKWAEQSKTEKNLSRLNRVSVVRELAKYMNSVGEQAYLLPLQLTKKTGRHIPYIYSRRFVQVVQGNGFSATQPQIAHKTSGSICNIPNDLLLRSQTCRSQTAPKRRCQLV